MLYTLQEALKNTCIDSSPHKSINTLVSSSLHVFPLLLFFTPSISSQLSDPPRLLEPFLEHDRQFGRSCVGRSTIVMRSRLRNVFNVVDVPLVPSATTRKKGSESAFVPSFLLSNVMSLVPKIDDVCYITHHANHDFVCLVESCYRAISIIMLSPLMATIFFTETDMKGYMGEFACISKIQLSFHS